MIRTSLLEEPLRWAVFALPALSVWTVVPGWSHPFVLQPYLLALGAAIILGRTCGFSPDFRDRSLWGVLAIWALVLGFAWARGFREAGLLPLAGMGLFLGIATGGYARSLVWGMALAAGGVSVFGLLQFAFPGGFSLGLDAPGKLKVFSTLGNPNFVAGFLAASLPYVLSLRTASAKRSRMAVGMGILVLAGLAASRCRHAWLAIGAMGLWVAMNRLRGRGRWLLGGGVVVLLGGLILCGLPGWDAPFGPWHTLKGRLLINAAAVEVLSNHPFFGVGLGRFSSHFGEAQAAVLSRDPSLVHNAGSAADAHNGFLHWAAEGGWPMALAGIALIVACLRRAWRSEPGCGAWIAGISLVGQVSGMLFEAPLERVHGTLAFWVALGIISAGDGRGGGPSPARASGGVRLGLAVGLAALAGWGGARRSMAMVWESRGDAAALYKDPWLAERNYAKALGWSPRQVDLRRKRGVCLYLLNRWPEASDEFDFAMDRTGDIGSHVLVAELLTRSGRFEEASTVCEKLISQYPGFLTPRFLLGQILLTQGDLDHARAVFEQALLVIPSPRNPLASHEKTEFQQRLIRAWLQKDREDRGNSRRDSSPATRLRLPPIDRR